MKCPVCKKYKKNTEELVDPFCAEKNAHRKIQN